MTILSRYDQTVWCPECYAKRQECKFHALNHIILLLIISICCQVQKNSTDPLYKERFLFTIDQYEVDQRIVQLQVFSVDKYQRHKVIGEAEIRVGDIDLNYPIRTWLNLRDIDEVYVW